MQLYLQQYNISIWMHPVSPIFARHESKRGVYNNQEIPLIKLFINIFNNCL